MASLIRSWLIRGLILTVIAFGAYAVWFATTWVSPEKVRASVEAHLSQKLGDGIKVHVGGAHLRLFGGITVTDLRLTRRGESEPFMSVPSALISHDKERLHRGELTIRKIELDRPMLRLVRSETGDWNIPVITPTSDAGEVLPTLVVRDATLWLSDSRRDGFPAVVLMGVRLQMVNDPHSLIKFDGQATLAAANAVGPDGKLKPDTLAIPLTSAVRLTRSTGQMSMRLNVPDLELTPDYAPIITRLHPKLGTLLTQFSAKSNLTVELVTAGDSARPLKYDVKVDLREGRFEDESLPWPVEQVAGTIRCQDGRVTVEKLTARLGHATAELSVRSKAGLLGSTPLSGSGKRMGPVIPALTLAEILRQTHPCGDSSRVCQESDPLRAVEDALDRFELTVKGLSLDDDLFARLTPKANRLREMFHPVGGVDVSLRYQRTDHDGGWRREVEVRPNKLTIEYEKFRYPVTDLTGTLQKVNSSDGTDEFLVNLIGSVSGRRVELTGKVAGDGPDPYVSLRIAGTDIPVDDRLISALKPRYAEGLKKMRGNARGDFVVEIHQDFQVNRAINTFHIRVYNGTINYAHFPYPFQQVRGNVRIRTEASDRARPLRPGLPADSAGADTTRVEFKNFEAVHDGGRLWLSGESEGIPGSEDRKVTLRLQGENCPIDNDFKTALKTLKLDGVVHTLAPKGELTFGADMEIIDRSHETPSELVMKETKEKKDREPITRASAQDSPTAAAAATTLPGQPPFTPEKDLKLAFHFKGPSIKPGFFPYEMHNLAGLLRYQAGRLEMVKFSARHGSTEIRLDAGELRFADAGEVWANLGGLTMAPLTADAALLRALPGKLRTGLQELNVRGPAELHVKHLVIRVPPTLPGAEPTESLQVMSSEQAHAMRLAETESPATSARVVVRGQLPEAPPIEKVLAADQPPASSSEKRPAPDRWRVIEKPRSTARVTPDLPIPVEPPENQAQPSAVVPAAPSALSDITPVRTPPAAASTVEVRAISPAPTVPMLNKAALPASTGAESRMTLPDAPLPLPPITLPDGKPTASETRPVVVPEFRPSAGPDPKPHFAPEETKPTASETRPVVVPETRAPAGADTKPAAPPATRFPFALPWQKKPVKPAEAAATTTTDEAPMPVIYWNAVLKLNGASLDAGLGWDDVYGSIASVGRYEGTHLGAVTGTAWFDKAVIARQPIASAKVGFRVRPQQADPLRPGTFLAPAIEFHDMTASLFQGAVSGEGRVVLTSPVRYRLWLSASGVQLEELARHYKLASGAELRGAAQGQLLIENQLDAKTGQLETVGVGQIDVPHGRMYNLPVLLDLVKVLKGQVPDGCAFEEAHTTFQLKGDRVKVTQLDLLGSAVSLGGSGEMDLEGKQVKFEFFTIWSQTLKRWLSTPLGDVTGLLSGSLFKIELTRENGVLVPRAHMLPVVSDPVRAVAERLRNRTGRAAETGAQPTAANRGPITAGR